MWPNSISSQTTYKNPQSPWGNGSSNSSRVWMVRTTHWPRLLMTSLTREHTLRWYDTGVRIQPVVISKTSLRSSPSSWRLVGATSQHAIIVWRPGTSRVSFTTLRGTSTFPTPPSTTLKSHIEDTASHTTYPPVRLMYPTLLLEHWADERVMSPPGQAAKLPPCWFVDNAIILSASHPHSHSPRIGPEGDHHSFVMPWYQSHP
jgi:hypothetical protein